MAKDPFSNFVTAPDTFGSRGRNITPTGSDVNLDPIPKAIMTATAGVLAYVPAGNGDAEVITLNVVAGFMPPHRPRRIKASTTCTVWTVED